ncbi:MULTISPECIES: hypothetical protein [Alphaproteobacteria]|uniref:Uncharacterized protein n=2 Tax=Alphaproteobacteria TaxID=28211 RepID=A0A512HGS3_9HYPH|nr:MULTISPECIES: hypothetical protein [Alphaproteobacteria]GEO84655.1 hypothetical protein RNA01_15870 [Ciceribacter naphthalenivorans]GLR20724.1 hypothetical protein GCM10007920_05080 [Ciceribacter naphthalenivorans]GLT03580.1 hypothetical protein GCM10007926_05080 [Sphingomonas psychrolutea]
MKKILVASDGDLLIDDLAELYAASKGVAIHRTKDATDVSAAIIDDDVLCLVADRNFHAFKTLQNAVGNKKIFLVFDKDPGVQRLEEAVRVFNDLFVGAISQSDMVKILHKHCSTSFKPAPSEKVLELDGFTLRVADKYLIEPSGKRVSLSEREFDFVRFHFEKTLGNEVLEETEKSIIEMDRKDALVYKLKKKISGVRFIPTPDKNYRMQLD